MIFIFQISCDIHVDIKKKNLLNINYEDGNIFHDINIL